MENDWLSGLFNPMTPGWGAAPGGSMAASYPQITPTMLYPFMGGAPQVGGPPQTPETAPWLTPPQFGDTSQTNAEGQPLDATGQPIPSVSGGAIPSAPPAMAYAQNQAAGANTANPRGGLSDALRGVQAMAPPQAQKVSTPHAPPQKPIQHGQLINLLSSLGIGPRDVFQLPRLQVPGVR